MKKIIGSQVLSNRQPRKIDFTRSVQEPGVVRSPGRLLTAIEAEGSLILQTNYHRARNCGCPLIPGGITNKRLTHIKHDILADRNHCGFRFRFQWSNLDVIVITPLDHLQLRENSNWHGIQLVIQCRPPSLRPDDKSGHLATPPALGV